MEDNKAQGIRNTNAYITCTGVDLSKIMRFKPEFGGRW